MITLKEIKKTKDLNKLKSFRKELRNVLCNQVLDLIDTCEKFDYATPDDEGNYGQFSDLKNVLNMFLIDFRED